MSSESYIEFKKAFHQKRHEITETKVEFSQEGRSFAKVVFEDEDGEEYELESDAGDFISLVAGLRSTFREGEKRIVDLEGEKGIDGSTYYNNMDYFISEKENPLDRARERLIEGGTDLPEDVSIEEALDALMEENYQNNDLEAIVENYYDALGALLMEIANIESSYTNMEQKGNNIRDYTNKPHEIFQDSVFTLPPLEAYEKYRDKTSCNALALMESHNDLKEKMKADWGAHYEANGGRLQGKIGMRKILEDYSSFFEIIYPVLRDLAALLWDENNRKNEELSNKEDVLRFLRRQGYRKITGPVEPQLRHGPAHESVKIDDEEGKIRVYSDNSRDRELEEEYDFEKVPEKLNKMQKIVAPVLMGYVMDEYITIHRTLASRDFKFKIIENWNTNASI